MWPVEWFLGQCLVVHCFVCLQVYVLIGTCFSIQVSCLRGMQKLCTAQASGDLSFLGNSVATSHMAQYEVEEPSLTQCIGWQRLCQGLAQRLAQLGAPYAKSGRF